MRLALRIVLAAAGVVAIAAIAGAVALLATAEEPPRPVGFQALAVADPDDRPLEVGVWYPTDAPPRFQLVGLAFQRVAKDAPLAGAGLPLVVMSHGNGGLYASHADTALALAAAGFVVAAVTHTGDNARDDRYVGSVRWLVDRPRHVRRVLDYMLQGWAGRTHLDPARIGVFGFSAGGFTALVASGGVPDLERIAQHCAAKPEFACQLWKPQGPVAVAPGAWTHDERIKAAVVAAPGFGFAFEPAGLAQVRAPVQLWNAEADRNVPYETNAAIVRRLLPRPPEFAAVPGAGHFAFLRPCPGWLFPAICRDAAGFDRAAFHGEFNASVIAFYRRELAKP